MNSLSVMRKTCSLFFMLLFAGAASVSAAQVSEWRMDEQSWNGAANEVIDSVGGLDGQARTSGNNSSLPTTVSAQVCQGGRFRGQGFNDPSQNNAYTQAQHYVEFPDSSSLSPLASTGSISLSGWIRPDASGNLTVLHKGQGGGSQEYQISLENQRIRFTVWNANGSPYELTVNDINLVSGTWYFFGASAEQRGNGNHLDAELFLFNQGGTLLSSVDTSWNPFFGGNSGDYGNKTLTGTLIFGGERFGGGAPVNFFDGVLDEIRLHDSALAESEFQTLAAEARTCPGATVLPVFDNFESYPPGTITGRNGGTGWGDSWQGASGQSIIDTSANPLLFEATNGLSIRSQTTLAVNGNNNRVAARSLSGTFSGDQIYLSMLVRFQGTPSDNDFLGFWVQRPGFGDSPQFGVKVNEGGGGDADFFVRLDANAAYSTEFQAGQTYLLVARFDKDGSNFYKQGRLWVNPQCTDSPPPTPSASISRNPNKKVTEINELGFRSENLSGGASVEVGQVAAGEGWTDVVQCACYQNGLEATFYNNYESGDPFPDSAVLTRLDPEVDFDWGNGSPDLAVEENDFAVQWQGTVEAPVSGMYQFQTRTDDGVRLWVEELAFDQSIIDDWNDHAAANRTSDPIYLKAGQRYAIRMQFYENGGRAVAQLSWQTPGSDDFEIVPASALFNCLNVANALDHFRITSGGNAVTCSPAPVTIQASDASGLPITDYAGTISLATSTGQGDWFDGADINGTLSRGSANSGQASYGFSPADNGVVSLNLRHTLADTVNVNVADGSVTELSGFDPNIVFAETGFLFHQAGNLSSPIERLIAGKDSSINPDAQSLALTAVRTNDDTGACEAFLTGAQEVEVGYVCNSPGSCALADALQINNQTVASNNNGSTTNTRSITLNFGDASTSSAPLVLNYRDAGRVSLFASLPLNDEDGNPTGGKIAGNSNAFVSVPAGFCLEPIEPKFQCETVDAQCSVASPAGEMFSMRLAAVGWVSPGEAGDEFCDNPVTPNFTYPDLDLTHELLAPTSGEPGVISRNRIEILPSDSGVRQFSQSVSEVGVFDFRVQSEKLYFGQPLPSALSAPVGRFRPAWFDFFIEPGAFSSVPMSADRTVCKPPLDEVDRDWVYTGEPFSWKVSTEIRISPKNKSGKTVKNYAGTAFQQLSSAGIELSPFPLLDEVQKGVDETLMELHIVGGSRSAGELRRDPLPAAPEQEGDLLYTFASDDEFFYKKSHNTRVSPFKPAPEFVLERIEDEDFVTAENPDVVFPEKFTPDASFKIRYGRIALENGYGPENMDLVIPVKAETFDGNGFELHKDESCWFYSLPENTTVNYDNSALENDQTEVVEVTDSERTLTDGEPEITPKDYRLRLSAPEPTESEDPQKQGLYVELNVGNDWLKDYWDAGNPDTRVDPYAWATFGVYRGNDRIIYWREVFNN